jgi:hypothetical protein
VWLNRVHTSKIDIQLNNTMRLIFGTVKSTQLQWLPVLANITLPKCDVKQPLLVNWWIAKDTWSPSCTNRCWIFPIKVCFPVDLCGILIHIRLRRFFQFLVPGLRHDQHRYLSTVIWLWIPMFDHLVSTYDDIIGCCWIASEPSREDARTSCIDGGSWNHQLVTVVLKNKQCVT